MAVCITLKLFRETGPASPCPWSVVDAGCGSRVGPRAASSCSEQKHCPRHVGNKHTHPLSAIYHSWKGPGDLLIYIGILHLRSKCHVVTNKQQSPLAQSSGTPSTPHNSPQLVMSKARKRNVPPPPFASSQRNLGCPFIQPLS